MDAEHRAETFERMAFEIKEERDALLFLFTHGYGTCDVCINRKEAEKENCEMDCNVCGLCICPCKNCLVNGHDTNFILDLEFVKEKMQKERKEND